MNVVAYCRVSTDKRDQLNSLETQKTFFEEYAQKMNYNLLHIYSDPGRSGTKIQKREDFQKMLTDAKTGDFSLILFRVQKMNKIRFLSSISFILIYLYHSSPIS